MATVLPLPWPTNRTVEGPRLRTGKKGLELEYDYEQDDGSRVWTRLVFSDVVTFEYRVDGVVRCEDIVGSQIVKYTDSPWLRACVQRLRESYPATIREEDLALLAEWRIYFDDMAAVAVIASSVEIG